MEVVAQLVRASDCGSEGRGFETHHPPQKRVFQVQLENPFHFLGSKLQNLTYIFIASIASSPYRVTKKVIFEDVIKSHKIYA